MLACTDSHQGFAVAFVVFGIAVALVILVNLAGRWSRKMPTAPPVIIEPLHRNEPSEVTSRAVVDVREQRAAARGELRPYSLEEVEKLSEQRTRAVEIHPPVRRTLSDAERFTPAQRDPSLSYHITYASEWGEVTERRINVKRVYWDRGLIYVEAYCHLRRDKRTFRADRMEDLRDADGRYVGGAVDHFGALIDPRDIITPGHELVMGKARGGLLVLIWIARAGGELGSEDIALLLGFCAERARVGRGAADFSEGLAERWIKDARPTFEQSAGALAGMRRGSSEWKLTLDTADKLAGMGDPVKRMKRLARLFKP